METVSFVVSVLEGPARVDLGNALVGLSGVAQVDIDEASHTVSVEYDPGFVNEKLIGNMIKSAGYAEGGGAQGGEG